MDVEQIAARRELTSAAAERLAHTVAGLRARVTVACGDRRVNVPLFTLGPGVLGPVVGKTITVTAEGTNPIEVRLALIRVADALRAAVGADPAPPGTAARRAAWLRRR